MQEMAPSSHIHLRFGRRLPCFGDRHWGTNSSASYNLDKLSPDLKELVVNKSPSTVKVVIQFNTSRLSKTLKDLLEKQSSVTNRLKDLNHWVVEARVSTLATICGFPEVTYVSTDREIKQLGHLSFMTRTDEIR